MRKIAIIPVLEGIEKQEYNNSILLERIQNNIANALETKLFDEVIVASDNEIILKLAVDSGANPYKYVTNLQLSKERIVTKILIEVIDSFKKKGIQIYYGCCIFSDAIIASSSMLKIAFERLVIEKYDSLFPVISYEYPTQKALILDDERLKMLLSEYQGVNSKALVPTFYDCEQFYLFRVASLLKHESLLTANTGTIVLPDRTMLNQETNWKLAEIKFETLPQELTSDTTRKTKCLIKMIDKKTIEA